MESSDDRGIVPIETDEKMKMEAVKTQYRKQAAFTMFVGVLWTLIYFWPVLAGGAELGGYLMKSLLESNAGILVLFCMLYLLLSGLAGIASYLVWCQMAKRNLSRKCRCCTDLILSAVAMTMMFGMYQIDRLFHMEPSGKDTWMTGNGPFLKCSEEVFLQSWKQKTVPIYW